MITAIGSFLSDHALLPDSVIAWGIRRLCQQRLDEESAAYQNDPKSYLEQRIAELCQSQIAVLTDKANQQHYEVAAEFFVNCLGPRLKYSSCFYPGGDESLAQAEEEMLKIYEQRAEIEDGMSILELGCGWGSLTLWLAQRFPDSKITAVSNSKSQREFILARAEKAALTNIEIITADINELELDRKFDRILSVEMFEHLRNYQQLFARISSWMSPHSKMFVHVFCHKLYCYPYETSGAANWMGRYFFSGGYMPSVDLFERFSHDLKVKQRWLINGCHYEKTARHWLENMDANKDKIIPVFEKIYGQKQAKIWIQRWRIFFLACAGLFGFNAGQQWMVAHYLFEKSEN